MKIKEAALAKNVTEIRVKEMLINLYRHTKVQYDNHSHQSLKYRIFLEYAVTREEMLFEFDNSDGREPTRSMFSTKDEGFFQCFQKYVERTPANVVSKEGWVKHCNVFNINL